MVCAIRPELTNGLLVRIRVVGVRWLLAELAPQLPALRICRVGRGRETGASVPPLFRRGPWTNRLRPEASLAAPARHHSAPVALPPPTPTAVNPTNATLRYHP